MAWCRHAIFAVRDDAVDWHNDNLRCHHCTYKMPIRYILSSVWVRLSIFSPLSIIQYVGLYVFSLPISHVMIERVYILCLIIIIKSEVWTITHCLGLGHETMVFAVCLSIFLLTTKLASWQFSVFSNCHIFTVRISRYPNIQFTKCLMVSRRNKHLPANANEVTLKNEGKINKSHNAPVPYPTIHHSEQKCVHFCCSEWCIVGYGTGAL